MPDPNLIPKFNFFGGKLGSDLRILPAWFYGYKIYLVGFVSQNEQPKKIVKFNKNAIDQLNETYHTPQLQQLVRQI